MAQKRKNSDGVPCEGNMDECWQAMRTRSGFPRTSNSSCSNFFGRDSSEVFRIVTARGVASESNC